MKPLGPRAVEKPAEPALSSALDLRHLRIPLLDGEKALNLQGSVSLAHAVDVEELLRSGKTPFRSKSDWMRAASHYLFNAIRGAIDSGTLDPTVERRNKLLEYLQHEGERLDFKDITERAERAILNLWESHDYDGALACLNRVLGDASMDNPKFGRRVSKWAKMNPKLKEVRAHAEDE